MSSDLKCIMQNGFKIVVRHLLASNEKSVCKYSHGKWRLPLNGVWPQFWQSKESDWFQAPCAICSKGNSVELGVALLEAFLSSNMFHPASRMLLVQVDLCMFYLTPSRFYTWVTPKQAWGWLFYDIGDVLFEAVPHPIRVMIHLSVWNSVQNQLQETELKTSMPHALPTGWPFGLHGRTPGLTKQFYGAIKEFKLLKTLL